MKIKKLIPWALCLLAIGLIVASLVSMDFIKDDTIKIGSFSKAIDYGPYFIAKEKGWFEDVATKYGREVEYVEFQSLAPITEAFATDRVDMVFEAEPPAIVGKAAGMDIEIRGISASLTQEIIIPFDSDIKSIKDLKGKKIAVLAGTSSHYGLIKILAKQGISSNEIEIIDMVPQDAKVAFEIGKIDAWAVWPPWIEQLELSQKGFVLSDSQVFIQSIVVVRGKFSKEETQMSKELLQVVEKAKLWMAEHEKESQEIISKELGLGISVVKLAWSKHDFQATMGKKEISDIQAKADFLFEEEKLISQRVSAVELVQMG